MFSVNCVSAMFFYTALRDTKKQAIFIKGLSLSIKSYQSVTNKPYQLRFTFSRVGEERATPNQGYEGAKMKTYSDGPLQSLPHSLTPRFPRFFLPTGCCLGVPEVGGGSCSTEPLQPRDPPSALQCYTIRTIQTLTQKQFSISQRFFLKTQS